MLSAKKDVSYFIVDFHEAKGTHTTPISNQTPLTVTHLTDIFI